MWGTVPEDLYTLIQLMSIRALQEEEHHDHSTKQ